MKKNRRGQLFLLFLPAALFLAGFSAFAQTNGPAIDTGSPAPVISVPRLRVSDMGSVAPSTNAPAASQPPSPDLTGFNYERATPAAYLESAVRASDPKAVIIPASQFQTTTDGKFRVKKKGAKPLPDEVYLAMQGLWIEPTTPPSATKPLPVEVGRMMLADVSGDVQVSSPFKDVEMVPGVSGMILPSGASIKTGENSSAAAVLSGLQSVRLGPSSQAKIEQSLKNKTNVTRVNLVDGTVFSRIGRPPGFVADFKVVTPQGVAAARGTDYAVWLRDNRMVVCSASGTINITDPSDKPLGELLSPSPGNLMFQAVPPMSADEQAEWLFKTLNLIQTLNQKTALLLETQTHGKGLPEIEKKWLSHLHPVSYVIKAKRIGAAEAPNAQSGR